MRLRDLAASEPELDRHDAHRLHRLAVAQRGAERPVALHVAHGMARTHAWDRKDTLARIRRAFFENLDYQERKLKGRSVD